MKYFTQLVIFILIAFPFKSTAQDCKESLKIQEKNVIDIITLYGKYREIENIVMGSYNTGASEQNCNHHIVVKYARRNEEFSSEDYPVWDTIIRYFNLNELGNPLTPPVFMHARQPIIIEKPEEPAEKLLYPSYECEQRHELEERDARWFGDTNTPATWVASMVIPKRHYPFCEYHVFLMYPKVPDDPDSEIWFTHVEHNETWYWHVGGLYHPTGREFKGRKIPRSEIPLPH